MPTGSRISPMARIRIWIYLPGCQISDFRKAEGGCVAIGGPYQFGSGRAVLAARGCSDLSDTAAVSHFEKCETIVRGVLDRLLMRFDVY